MRIKKFADDLIEEMKSVIISGEQFKPAHYAKVILNDFIETKKGYQGKRAEFIASIYE
jgi:hypothetical protein